MSTTLATKTLRSLLDEFRTSRFDEFNGTKIVNIAGTDTRIRVDYLSRLDEDHIEVEGKIGGVPVRMTLPATVQVSVTWQA